jgi:hypothetical protein
MPSSSYVCDAKRPAKSKCLRPLGRWPDTHKPISLVWGPAEATLFFRDDVLSLYDDPGWLRCDRLPL